MLKKRGQAAMEFLMTYGWAILAVLLTIISLAYFGVLNIGLFLPESCTLFPGVACTDFVVAPNYIIMKVRNGFGSDLQDFSISVPGCSAPATANGGVLSDGESEILGIGCTITDTRFKNDITITYSTKSGLSHTKTGKISGKTSQTSTSIIQEGCSVDVSSSLCPSPLDCPSSPDSQAGTSVGSCKDSNCANICDDSVRHADYSFTLTTLGDYIAIIRTVDYKYNSNIAGCTAGTTLISTNFNLNMGSYNYLWYSSGSTQRWIYATVPFSITSSGTYKLIFTMVDDCVCVVSCQDPKDLNLYIDEIQVVKV